MVGTPAKRWEPLEYRTSASADIWGRVARNIYTELKMREQRSQRLAPRNGMNEGEDAKKTNVFGGENSSSAKRKDQSAATTRPKTARNATTARLRPLA